MFFATTFFILFLFPFSFHQYSSDGNIVIPITGSQPCLIGLVVLFNFNELLAI